MSFLEVFPPRKFLGFKLLEIKFISNFNGNSVWNYYKILIDTVYLLNITTLEFFFKIDLPEIKSGCNWESMSLYYAKIM